MVISIQPANHSSNHDAEEDTNQPTTRPSDMYPYWRWAGMMMTMMRLVVVVAVVVFSLLMIPLLLRLFFCSNSEVCIVPQDCLDWGPAGLWEVINRWKLLCDVTAAPGLWRLTPFLLVAVIVMIRILELFLLHLLSMADFNCNCSCCWNKRDFNFMVCQSFPNGRTDGWTNVTRHTPYSKLKC